jgi:hypothetical protein
LPLREARVAAGTLKTRTPLNLALTSLLGGSNGLTRADKLSTAPLALGGVTTRHATGRGATAAATATAALLGFDNPQRFFETYGLGRLGFFARGTAGAWSLRLFTAATALHPFLKES